MNLELQISFKELISDIPKISPQNLTCSLYLSEKSNFIFLANITLNPPQNLFSLTDLFSKKTHKLQFRFQHNKIFLGSISIPIDNVLELSPNDLSQWFEL